MDKELSQLIDQSQVDSVMAPIDQAMTPPAIAYTDPVWFDLERRRVFERRWMAVRFESVLPRVGDAEPFEVFGMPLLAVRGDDDRVRVFHNICPYDGCLVLSHAQSGLGEMVVLYHGWRYDLRGKLIEAPFWNGEPHTSPDQLGGRDGDLVEVRSEIRFGVVFVNFTGDAQAIDEWLSPWGGPRRQ